MGIVFNTDSNINSIRGENMFFKRGSVYPVKKIRFRRNSKFADLFFAQNGDNPFQYTVCELVPTNIFEVSGSPEIEHNTDEDD